MANQVVVEISARHVHVSKEDLETLFGKDYQLTVKKELSQPGAENKTCYANRFFSHGCALYT